MTKDSPLPPLPDTPSNYGIQPKNSLDVAFDAMLLDPSSVSLNDFSNEWGATNTEEEALMLSSVDDARLKNCIVAASVLVWGIPTMHLAWLEVCYCLLHPRQPNF
jgi:hypothetical protein